MPGPIPGVLWIKDSAGQIHEIINQARTAAYLQNADLTIPGIMACDVTDYGGCAMYAFMPFCEGEETIGAEWVEAPADSDLMQDLDESDWTEDPADSDLMEWTP